MTFWNWLLAFTAALSLHLGTAAAQPKAELIHFTESGQEDGAPLLPGFALNSVWSAMGQAPGGRIYIGVSNHAVPGGNTALFSIEPGADRMSLVGDLKSASLAVNNWREGENQFKIHTFLSHHADGGLYFASMPANNPQNERGGRIYRLDPETNAITDLSASAPFRLTETLQVVPNDPETGGVFAAQQGIKGLGLNPAQPNLLYAMLQKPGPLFRIELDSGNISKIGSSASVSYAFHVADNADVYYLGGEDADAQDILRYNATTGKTEVLKAALPKDEVGMTALMPDGKRLLMLLAKAKQVMVIDMEAQTVAPLAKACGKNWWKLFNMTLAPDGTAIYYVSNNNNNSMIWKQDTSTGKCKRLLNVNDLLGTRNLAFGGKAIWQGNSFFTPVWTHQGDDDTAILKVTVN